jgi:hypothetical protein
MTPDAQPSHTVSEWLEVVGGAEGSGEHFRAVDLADRGLREHPDECWIMYRAVRSLANAGAPAEARRRYDQYRLADFPDEDIVALDARLLKDEAFATAEPQRSIKLLAAAVAYESAASGTPLRTYPAINAATLYHLAGARDRSVPLARQIVALLRPPLVAGSLGYWDCATLIEAHILAGELAEARALVPLAVSASAGNQASRASTWRQLQSLAKAGTVEPAWFDGLRPAGILHYATPPMIDAALVTERSSDLARQLRRRIRRALDARRIGVAYGSLSSGLDMLAAGAELHVVLPSDEEAFVETAIRPAGARWVERFRCSR